MNSFKFLFFLYVTFIIFSGKIRSISWLLCNTGKYFLKIVLILGSIGLYCVIKRNTLFRLGVGSLFMWLLYILYILYIYIIYVHYLCGLLHIFKC